MSNKQLSILVKRMLPDFIASEYPDFVMFIQKFFEWLEEEKHEYDLIANLLDYRNVDESIAPFLDEFKAEYLPQFPTALALDIPMIVKQIREFYKAKGTEDSFVFLFKMLWDSDVTFYYPKIDILKTSDGTWEAPTYLVLQDDSGNTPVLDSESNIYSMSNLTGYQISGDSSGADAFTSNTVAYFWSPKMAIGADIAFTSGTKVISSLTTDLSGFADLDTISISGSESNDGTYTVDGASTANSLVVTEALVDEVAEPEIKIFETSTVITTSALVLDTISGTFEDGETLTVTDGPDDMPSVLKVASSGLINLTSRYTNEDGWLSSGKKLQDNWYYQDYSYEITSSVSPDIFEKVVKDNLHPAGFILHSQYVELETLARDAIISMEDFILNLVMGFTTSGSALDAIITTYEPEYDMLSLFDVNMSKTYSVVEATRENTNTNHMYSTIDSISNLPIGDFNTKAAETYPYLSTIDIVYDLISQLLSLPTWDDTGKLIPGEWTDGRSSDILLPDNEGQLVAIDGDHLPYDGARHVENTISLLSGGTSEDLLGGWRTGTNTTIVDSETWTSQSSNVCIETNPAGGVLQAGDELQCQVSVTVSAACSIRICMYEMGGGVINGNYVAFAAGETKTIAARTDGGVFVAAGGGTGHRFRIYCDTSGVTITHHYFQAEDVTGKTNQNPSEYQLVDATHDGIATYNIKNPAIVDHLTGVVETSLDDVVGIDTAVSGFSEGATWSIVGDTLVANGPASLTSDGSMFTSGVYYKLEVDAVGTGILSCYIGSGQNVSINVVGSKHIVIYGLRGSNSSMYFYNNYGDSFVLSNIKRTPLGRYAPNINIAIYGDSFATTSGIGTNLDFFGLRSTTVRRLAAGGATVAQTKTQLDADLATATEEVCLINCSINDFVGAVVDPGPTIIPIMEQMIRDVLAVGKFPVIYLPIPWKGGTAVTWNADRQAWMDSYRAYMLSNYPDYCVDCYSLMEDPDNPDYLSPVLANADLLHPNTRGYVVMDSAFPSVLDTLILPAPSLAHCPANTNLALDTLDVDTADTNWATYDGGTATPAPTIIDPEGKFKASLVDLSAHANARVGQSIVGSVEGDTYEMALWLRALDGESGTFPIAAGFAGSFIGSQATLNDSTWTKVVMSGTIAFTQTMYVGNRRDGTASTLTKAYVWNPQWQKDRVDSPIASVAATPRDTVAIQHPRAGYFDETQGTVMLRMKMGQDSKVETFAHGIMTTRNGSQAGFAYMATGSNGKFRSFDGTGVANTPAVTWSAGDEIILVIAYGDTREYSLRNVTQDGEWQHESVSFDGAYHADAVDIEYFKMNSLFQHLLDQEILSAPLDNDAVEARYA